MDEPLLITLSGCSLLAGGLLVWLATRPRYRVRVTPPVLQVPQYEQADVAVVIERKRRVAFRWRPVAGTFIVSNQGSEGKLAACPTLGSSAADDAGFVVQVTGLEVGADRVRLSATPAGATAAIMVEIPVSVAPNPRGTRRIRDTAVALSRTVPS
jgi:hypothetical protein